MNTSPYFKTINIIFSDSNDPGEGEHKIMNYIRAQRSKEDYNPNLHHILHGLDADLIMLGLATHELRFTILREQVFIYSIIRVESETYTDHAWNPGSQHEEEWIDAKGASRAGKRIER